MMANSMVVLVDDGIELLGDDSETGEWLDGTMEFWTATNDWMIYPFPFLTDYSQFHNDNRHDGTP
jgi:hypothetical protein